MGDSSSDAPRNQRPALLYNFQCILIRIKIRINYAEERYYLCMYLISYSTIVFSNTLIIAISTPTFAPSIYFYAMSCLKTISTQNGVFYDLSSPSQRRLSYGMHINGYALNFMVNDHGGYGQRPALLYF